MLHKALPAILVVGLMARVCAADVSIHIAPGDLNIDDGTQVLYVVLTSTTGTDLLLGSIGFTFDTAGDAWAALNPSAFAWVPDVMNDPASWFVIDDLPDPIAVAFSPGSAIPLPDGVKVTIAALTVTPGVAGIFSFSLGAGNITNEFADPLQLKGGDPAAIRVIASDPGCCAPRVAPGCADAAIENCVCAIRPACCTVAWSCECVALAATGCGSCAGVDCNVNGVPDACDVSLGTSGDCDTNGLPDECEVPPICPGCLDCNGNMIPDVCDLSTCAVGSAGGSTWFELGDAGALPADAQIVAGSGPVKHIVGSTGADRVDMYQIMITDPLGFSAWTSESPGGGVGSASFDTELWLFDVDGRGVLGNDDNPGPAPFHSGISVPATDGTGAAPSSPGVYYLAVSGFRNDPLGVAGPVFDLFTFTEISGPDGPGGGVPIAGWSGGGPSGGYDVFVTGAAFVPQLPFVCDCNANGVPDDCDIAGGTSSDVDGNGVPDECSSACGADADCDDLVLCTVDGCGIDGTCVAQAIVYGDVNNDGVASADDVNCLLDEISGDSESLACCDRLLGTCSGPGDTLPAVGSRNKDPAPCLGCPRVSVNPDAFDCHLDCSGAPCPGGLLCVTLVGGGQVCRDPNNMGDGFTSSDDVNAVLDTIGGAVPSDGVMPPCLACTGGP